MNLWNNFIIKAKIENLVEDLLKSDNLNGAIFDIYIDLETFF